MMSAVIIADSTLIGTRQILLKTLFTNNAVTNTATNETNCSSGVFGLIPYTPLEQLVSLVAVLVTALLVNNVLSNIWRVPINVESAIITALIIYFLVIPAQWSDLGDTWVIAVVAAIRSEE